MPFTKPKGPDPDYAIGQLVRTRPTGDKVVQIANVWPRRGDDTVYRVVPETGTKSGYRVHHGQITEVLTFPKRSLKR
jgi:hypothetical protein